MFAWNNFLFCFVFFSQRWKEKKKSVSLWTEALIWQPEDILRKVSPGHYEEVSRLFSFLGEDAVLLISCNPIAFFYLLIFQSLSITRSALLRGSFKKVCMLKMDRAGFAVLMVLTVALVRVGDSREDTTGGRTEGAGAALALWDQQLSQVRSQGHSPRGPVDGASSRLSGETSPGSSHSRSHVRLPRGASSHGDGRHVSAAGAAHTAGASREDLASAPRDGAQRTARHPANQQHRTKVNRRQSSRPSSASARRLVG